MKFVSIAILMTIGLLGLGLPSSVEASVLGFQAWKSGRIDEAKTSLERLQTGEKNIKSSERDKRSEAARGSSKSADDYVMPRLQSLGKMGRPDQKIQQAQLNLEIARELTVNDYFVLYLSQFKQRDAFVDAAKKLTPEEAADLMLAYQKYLASDDQPELPANSVTSGLPR